MNKRLFTQEQIDGLLSNKHIASCSEKSVTYTTTFKTQAVRLYEQGLTSTEIFHHAGLDLNVIGKDKPKECLGRWRKIVNSKGVEGLQEARGRHGKGGRPKTKSLTEAERIMYLEAQVAYLKAENNFLAKLRAKRKE